MRCHMKKKEKDRKRVRESKRCGSKEMRRI